MSDINVTKRVLRGPGEHFTSEARDVQYRALARRASVVRLGDVVFFASTGGDAWMVHVRDRSAACLARDGELEPVPIREAATKTVVAWSADYVIDGDMFTFTPRSGAGPKTLRGYPTAEIVHLVRLAPSRPPMDLVPMLAAQDRLKAGRNDPCPCGSGRKYKKCCLDRDELLVRETATALHTHGLERWEAVLAAAKAPDPGDREIGDDCDGDEAGGEYDELADAGANPPDDVAAVNESVATEIPPHVDEQLDRLWNEFEALEQPAAEQIEQFLNELLGLPPEATDWNDLFQVLTEHPAADFSRIFRRIRDGVPHTKATGLAFFYWEALERAIRRNERHLITEVVAGFRRLDRASYDADALKHLEDWLLAEGCETEALELVEHFVPILREDGNLMPYAFADVCYLLFQLRCGRWQRDECPPQAETEALAADLRRGIEDEVDADAAANAAAVITGRAPPPAWTRAEFELVAGDIGKSAKAWQHHLRVNALLMYVAREAWQTEAFPAGCAGRGLSLTCNSVYSWIESSQRSGGKKVSRNLLDYLRPQDLEARLAMAARGMMGVNAPRLRLLLEAHGILLRAAVRHQLISAPDAAATERELRRLAELVCG